MDAAMPLDATSNVLPFPAHRLSRRDRALIGQWRLSATALGVAGVHVRDEIPDDQVQSVADRITIRFKRELPTGTSL